jgi:hypothetical protein
MLAVVFAVDLARVPRAAAEAPTAEVAKRCLHYAYIVYPFKRPGAVPMSGDRQAWFKDCLAKNGEVFMPEGPAKPRMPIAVPIPASKAASNSGASNAPIQTGR